MTAAPIHWPGDGDAIDGKHMRAAVAGNAFGRDPGNREPLIGGVSQRRSFGQRAGGEATRLLGKHQAGNGWLEGGRS